MANLQLTTDQLSELIANGIASTLEARILELLREQVEPILKQTAHELARTTVTAVDHYYGMDASGFGPTIKLSLNFNNAELATVVKNPEPKFSRSGD